MVQIHRSNSGSAPICRNFTLAGRRTSIRMEQVYWTSLEQICEREGRSLAELVGTIDSRRGEINLTAALRLFVTGYFHQAMDPELKIQGNFVAEAEGDGEDRPLTPIESERLGSGLVGRALDVVGPPRANESAAGSVSDDCG